MASDVICPGCGGRYHETVDEDGFLDGVNGERGAGPAAAALRSDEAVLRFDAQTQGEIRKLPLVVFSERPVGHRREPRLPPVRRAVHGSSGIHQASGSPDHSGGFPEGRKRRARKGAGRVRVLQRHRNAQRPYVRSGHGPEHLSRVPGSVELGRHTSQQEAVMQSNKEQVLRSQESNFKDLVKTIGKGQEAKEMSVRSGLREERTVESYNDRSGR